MEASWLWIPLSVFAALMQSVRTAAQKQLNQRMSTMGTTYVRSLFGLPVLLVFLAAATLYTGLGAPAFKPLFVLHTAGGALTQVLATALLIQMFQLKNFAKEEPWMASDSFKGIRRVYRSPLQVKG